MKRLLPLIALVPCAFAIEPAGSSLVTLKRIYVESLGASPQAIMMRDMVISSIAGSGVIALTENPDHADAVLRGSADDQIYTEQHHSTDSITAGLHGSSSESYSSRYDHTSNGKSNGLNIGQNESLSSVERRHEASASVRLVNRDGDVIWSTTQESLGAKFKSSSADVADRIYRKLTGDVQKARSSASALIQPGMPTR